MLWSEPYGKAQNSADDEESGGGTDIEIADAKYGESAYHSIRRFAIVKTQKGHSLCL